MHDKKIINYDAMNINMLLGYFIKKLIKNYFKIGSKAC